MWSEISERFDLQVAHPMLLTTIIDPSKNFILGRYIETKQKALKKGIVELMKMHKGYEEHEHDLLESSPSDVKRPKSPQQ